VPKINSDKIRICVDLKKIINPVLDCDHCVLPIPEDIFACLSGKSCFSVIDLKGAYQQLNVSDKSKELLVSPVIDMKGILAVDQFAFGNYYCHVI